MECSDFFSTHEVIGSSLLFVHDRNQASVWLIDFAKTVVLPANIKIDHGSIWSVGNHEDGYLIGINNLIDIFEELLACEELNENSNQALNQELNQVSNQELSQVATEELIQVQSEESNKVSKQELNQVSSHESEQVPKQELNQQQVNEELNPEVNIVENDKTVPSSNNDGQLNNNSEKMCNLSIES